MASYNQTSPATKVALGYLTVGLMLVIWTIIYLVWVQVESPPQDGSNKVYFWCTGFILTGLTFVILGLSMGALGRSSRYADKGPPPVVMNPGVPPTAGQPVAAQPGAIPQTAAPPAPAAPYPQQ